MFFLYLLLLCSVLSVESRFHPTVTVLDVHGGLRSKEIFLWVSRLSEVKDRVQMRYRIPKDEMILFFIPVDRDGYQKSPVYGLDDSLTFSEVNKMYNEGRKGYFYVTVTFYS